ncbi:MAG: cyclodeaminase/cyclohydrolase family protein [Firmicutes bacterium]|nr:cyclodeaminase/cyclohydrolase family protein [Bacillota bacterium]
MDYTTKTCQEFAAALASKEPIPGGGGASAYVGALGIALGNMVGNLTLGKPKYQAVEQDIAELMQQAQETQAQLLSLVNEDATAFLPLSKAYGLPKNTPEEKAHRAAVMEEALQGACAVPLKIMEACARAIRILQDFAVKGSSIAISDVGVGVALCQAALKGASLNIFINVGLMKDRQAAEEWQSRAQGLLDEYIPLAEQIYQQVTARL